MFNTYAKYYKINLNREWKPLTSYQQEFVGSFFFGTPCNVSKSMNISSNFFKL